MALKFVVDTLEGIDEGLHGEYEEKDGKFHLKVDGLPAQEDVGGLKSALQKERDARSKAEKRISEIETESMKGKEQYKELYEKQIELNSELQNSYSKEKRENFVDKLVIPLTKDPRKAKLLKNEMLQLINVEDGQVKIVGFEKPEDLTAHFQEEFKFLIDASQASGGGATGNDIGGSDVKKMKWSEFNKLSPEEQSKFIRIDKGAVIPD